MSHSLRAEKNAGEECGRVSEPPPSQRARPARGGRRRTDVLVPRNCTPVVEKRHAHEALVRDGPLAAAVLLRAVDELDLLHLASPAVKVKNVVRDGAAQYDGWCGVSLPRAQRRRATEPQTHTAASAGT